QFPLELSPSASTFVFSSATATRKGNASQESLLSIGNPSFDKVAYPNLPNLQSAGLEAESITKYYKSSVLLLNEDARETRVKELIGKTNIVHFALHYVIDVRSEMLSKLVLAKESGGSNSDGKL